MSDDRGEATASDTTADRIREFLDAFGVLTPVVVALLVFIWLLLPLIPEDSGIAFGLWFRVFFTWILLAATAFFWMLDLERVPSPRSGGAALGSVGAVYFVTVAVLVGVGLALPQFEGRPASEGAAVPQTAVARGEALFWTTVPGCFQCHIIDGRGGTRAPDLTEVASRAPERVAGLTAEGYMREKIKAGLTYEKFRVPGFPAIMPPFETVLTDDQIDDLIAYLLEPK